MMCEHGKVGSCEECSRGYTYSTSGGTNMNKSMPFCTVEIIGNRHENPKLLEVGE